MVAHPQRKRQSRASIGKRRGKRGQPLRVGDIAVCPPHGVGEVVAIHADEIAGSRETFYHFRILGNGLLVMIPEGKVATAGLRPVIESGQVGEVLALLRRKRRSVTGATWSKRQRECSDKLTSGSIHQAAEVLRDLYLIRRDKDFSTVERQIFDTAERLVVTELSVASGKSEETIQAEIKAIFSR